MAPLDLLSCTDCYTKGVTEEPGSAFAQRLVLDLLRSMDTSLREIRDKLDQKADVHELEEVERRVGWLERERVSDNAAAKTQRENFEYSTAAWNKRDRVGAAAIAVVLVVLNILQYINVVR